MRLMNELTDFQPNLNLLKLFLHSSSSVENLIFIENFLNETWIKF